MNKTLLCALREFRSTVLTCAFIVATFVIPVVIWGAIIGVSQSGILDSEKDPLSGTMVIVDTTDGQAIAQQVASSLDPEAREAFVERMREEIEGNPMFALAPEEMRTTLTESAIKQMGLETDIRVEIEILGSDADIASLQACLAPGSEDPLIAYAIAGEASLQLPLPIDQIRQVASDMGVPITDEQIEQLKSSGLVAGMEEADPDEPLALNPGVVRIVHQRTLDPDYVSVIRQEFRAAVENQRYERAGIDPAVVRRYEASRPVIDTKMVGEDGQEEDSTAGVQRIVPLAFAVLILMSVLTGGGYLLMGTMEEKSSRVMEVVLSAVSPQQMLVGKIVGQGMVGLTVLAVYIALGLVAADHFNVLDIVPLSALISIVPYFMMAYLFFGALYIAVGSAVTEIRETQALSAPLTFLIIAQFLVLAPIMENPGSTIARVLSYIPVFTPTVMVMRLSQPSHVVPVWEIIATGVVGFAGVLLTVWIAAKIFRVGVLMYGKPPSFGTLLKWVMQS